MTGDNLVPLLESFWLGLFTAHKMTASALAERDALRARVKELESFARLAASSPDTRAEELESAMRVKVIVFKGN